MSSQPGSEARLWFVGGSARSGSTLLAGLIATAVKGFDAGELHLLWRSFDDGRLCTCGTTVANCEVWREVAERVLPIMDCRSTEEAALIEAREPSQKWVAARGMFLPLQTDVVKLRRETEQAIRDITGHEVIVDSSKVASTAAVALRVDRRSRLVHLVRDPRAVAYSSMNPKRDPSMPHGESLPYWNARRSAMHWISHNLAFERLRQQNVSVVRVRYEDLASSPRDVLRALKLPGEMVERAIPGMHAIAGNPWRFKPDIIQLDERWKTELPVATRRLVGGMTAPLRLRYGYCGKPC